MGGARRYPYPKWVWTPYGGWWPNPKNSNRNAALLGVGLVGLYTALWNYSEANTTVYNRADNSVTFSRNHSRTRAAAYAIEQEEHRKAGL